MGSLLQTAIVIEKMWQWLAVTVALRCDHDGHSVINHIASGDSCFCSGGFCPGRLCNRKTCADTILPRNLDCIVLKFQVVSQVLNLLGPNSYRQDAFSVLVFLDLFVHYFVICMGASWIYTCVVCTCVLFACHSLFRMVQHMYRL